MKTKEESFKGLKFSGIGMLIFNILYPCVLVFLIVSIDGMKISEDMKLFLSVPSLLLLLIWPLFWFGFMMVEPNEARVLMFFGKYKGTVKENGYFWVNPLYVKRKLTLRARNLDGETIKVNDKSGNPIMIGQVIVWKIVDTYKASFDIAGKSYEHFVRVQSDAALRYLAGMYAYDDSLNADSGLTLRSGREELNEILEKQLNERLDLAGIKVIEARINYLAYAPEIAAIMLRRQQADAIISAREKIVDGAVGMVKQALQKLSEEEVVELDEEKKAAMVSNLLVVLCSDEPAQPVINSGTLHN